MLSLERRVCMLLLTPFDKVRNSIPQKPRHSVATTQLPFPTPQKSHNQSERTCQTSINAHPPQPAEARRQKNGLRSSPLSNLPLSPSGFNAVRKKRKDPSLRTTRVLNGITLGHRGHKSHQPGWRFCGSGKELRRGRLL